MKVARHDNLITLENCYQGLRADSRSFDMHVDLAFREVRVRINEPDMPFLERTRIMFLVRHMFHAIGWSVRDWDESAKCHRLAPIDSVVYLRKPE